MESILSSALLGQALYIQNKPLTTILNNTIPANSALNQSTPTISQSSTIVIISDEGNAKIGRQSHPTAEFSQSSVPSFSPRPTLPDRDYDDYDDVPAIPAYQNWYQRAGRSPEAITQLSEQWITFAQEPYFDVFNTLLTRLGQGILQGRVIPQQVAEVIDEMVMSLPTRTAIFDAAQDADADCHDRVLLIFNNIQALAKASMLQRMSAGEGITLDFAMSLVRQRLLNEVVPQVIIQQWEQGRRAGNMGNPATDTGPNLAEALEVELALIQELAIGLRLPFPVSGVHTAMANLNPADLTLACTYVNTGMASEERLIAGLLAQPMWINYLTERFATGVSDINQRYTQAIEDFEGANAKGFVQTESYLPEMSRLRVDRDGDIQDYLKQKTQDILKQHLA